MIKFFHYEFGDQHYWVPEIDGVRLRAYPGEDDGSIPQEIRSLEDDLSGKDIPADELPDVLGAPGTFVHGRILVISSPGEVKACVAVRDDDEWLLPVCHGSETQTPEQEAEAVWLRSGPDAEVAQFGDASDFEAQPPAP